MSRPFTSLPTWILSSAATRSHQILHKHLANAGTDGYAYRCLSILAIKGHMSQAELGHATALDPRDVTHTVRQLEEKGLVRREKDPNHGRRVLVSMTTTGHDVTSGLDIVMADIQDEIFGALDLGEQTLLFALLDRLGRRAADR